MKKSMIILLLPFLLVACDAPEQKVPVIETPAVVQEVAKEIKEEAKEVEKIEDTMIDDIKEMKEQEEQAKKEESMDEKMEEEMDADHDSDESAEHEDGMEMMIKAEKYQDYSSELFSELNGKQDFILFFHASWCSTCVKWEKTIKENLATLPENTVILKADYDTEKDLKKKYGVTFQSTAVMISKDGTTKNQADPSVDAVSSFFSK